MIQIAALRSRLEKQPTELRRNPMDLGDGALLCAPHPTGSELRLSRLRVRWRTPVIFV